MIPFRIRVLEIPVILTVFVVSLTLQQTVEFPEDLNAYSECKQCPSWYTCALVDKVPNCIYLPNCMMLDCPKGEECIEDKPDRCEMEPCISSVSCQPITSPADPHFQVSDQFYHA